MRLNRVLLLAATINIMIFALVFTISCSGDDGKNGKNGDNCIVEPDGNGWNVLCGDELVGRLQGPGDSQGAPGAPGSSGADGRDGSYCWLDGYDVRCGTGIGAGEVKGTLSACDIKSVNGNDYETQIVCSAANKVSLCDNIVFDPTKNFCKDDGHLDLIENNTGTCQDGTKYSKNSQYCGLKDAQAKKESPLPLCFGPANATKLRPNKPINAILDNAVSCAAAGGEYEGTTCYVSEWKDEYCQFVSPKLARIAGKDAEDGVDGYCGGKRYNEGKWEAKYCGYLQAAKSGYIKEAQTGLCDDFRSLVDPEFGLGPNSVAYGRGYCEVLIENKATNKTVYSEKLCDNLDKPNNGKWNGEYCGKTSATNENTKLYKGICDDGKGPHEFDYNGGYCTVTQANKVKGTTEYTTDWCRPGSGSGSSSTSASAKINEGSWKGEYCGYRNKNAEENTYKWDGLCDDGNASKKDQWNEDAYCQADRTGLTTLVTEVCEGDSARVNENEWKGEYCGFATATATEKTRLTGACSEGDGPNADVFGGGYCSANRKGELTYTTNFCGESGKVNEGEWKGEYCGFANATSSTADKVYDGICDDDNGPNESSFNAGYCQWKDETSTGTTLTNTLCGESKINEGSWKGEYCYSDDEVAVCTGGRVPVTDKKSTDPYTVRCKFTSRFVCADDNLGACDKDGCDDLGAGFVWDEAAFECRAAAPAPR